GHMAKTRRLMREWIGMVDIVVELTDARIPYSSRNPEIGSIVGEKPRIILLNKCDSADEKITLAWVNYYKQNGLVAIPTDCKSGKGLNMFLPAVKLILKDLLERRKIRGNDGQPIRMMIVGVPNAGKSSLINRLAGSRRTKVEDRPGVTRGKQWVRIDGGVDLLDMPGVLWPKFEDPLVGEHLAFTGAVKDDVVDTHLLGIRLLNCLYKNYPQFVEKRYKFTAEEADGLEPLEFLRLIGKKRGMLLSGGEVDTERAAHILLDEFRGAVIGKISLETPEIMKGKEKDEQQKSTK
ncbi:MAG: ribosome biogenesis GTPase YlqF, partial [Oscillospiraceae bacterium]